MIMTISEAICISAWLAVTLYPCVVFGHGRVLPPPPPMSLDYAEKYDIVLGFVFVPTENIVPVNFNRFGINNNHRIPFADKASNYSVLNECSKMCDGFLPSFDANGSRCDAWTVTVYDRNLPASSFECTLYERANPNVDIEIDEACGGCSAGVVHKTWAFNVFYEALFIIIVSLQLFHLVRTIYKYRNHGELLEFIQMSIESFLPATFAVIEMAESACSATEDFVPALLSWLILTAIPEKLYLSRRIAIASKSEELFEALHHSLHDHESSSDITTKKKRQPNHARVGEGRGCVNDDDGDDDDMLLEDASWVEVPLLNQLDTLRKEHEQAEHAADAIEPVYQYHRSVNGGILIHLFLIVRHQESRKSAALLYLFFGIEHLIPVFFYVTVTLIRKTDRKKLYKGLKSFWSEMVSCLYATSFADCAYKLFLNRSIGMIISITYTTYYLHIVLVDYKTTSGDHVTCMPLVPFLSFD